MDTLEDLKNQFLTEQQDELSHAGVKGMKWGRRKAEVIGTSTRSNPQGDGKNAVTGFFDRPNAAKALLLGSYGKKSSYTDPVALTNRKTAGKLRIAAALASVGSVTLAVAGKNSAGAQAVSGILSTGGSLVSIASIAKGTQAAYQEKSARNAA